MDLASKLWLRIAPKSTTAMMAAMCVLFCALLVLGVYRGQNTAGVSAAPRFGIGIGPVAVSGDLDPSDPVARFAETRVGHVLFVSGASDHCQRVLFDNQTGGQYQAASVDCVRPAAEVVASSDRLGAMRRTFQK